VSLSAPVETGPATGGVPQPDDRSSILIVDDLPEKLLVFGTVLEDLGQHLVFVRSGSEALREVLHREFAVILLDVNMPDIDGFETAALIRRYKRSAHTPIIFITAYADEMQTARGYSLGAVDYILSPVVPEMLRSKVKVFVDLHQMQRRVRRQAEERVELAAAESARRVAEENDRRSAFLAHASRVLSGSLDVTVGARELLALVVPRIAPLAVLQLVDGRDLAPQVLVAARQGEEPLHVVEAAAGAMPQALSEAMAQAVQRHDRVVLHGAALRHMHAEALGVEVPRPLKSALAVPLMIGSRVLGVLMVASAQREEASGPHDGAALEELASRAAIAFENAHLYRSLEAEIVERRAAEAELQEASQRKDEFLAMLSHELRNPLAPIRNALEIIRRIAPPDPKFTWASDVMDRQVHHLTRLVEELLDVARISQGKIQLNKEPVDLAAVIAQSVETAQPFIDARNHVLTVQLPECPVWLQGDFARLAQVVSNLLHNAAKYSEDGGRIQLALSVHDGEAQIIVRDNGIGIDEALLPRIFDLFAQGTRSLDRMQGGLGVGLTLARRLVELHGGRVEAYSEGPRKGAEFRVTIPCVSVVPRDDGMAWQGQVTPAACGWRVLIVDDNQDAADSIAQYLQFEGHEVKTVSDGLLALNCAPVFAPHIVVLDIGLPMMDGYEVARRLRQMPVTQHALLIAMTGYGQKEDQQRAAQAGFDRHFVKPTDPRMLVQFIAEWPGPPVGQAHEQADAG
jgi:signal transduction histidine kinase